MSRQKAHESNGETLDTTELPSLPVGWCWTALETVAEIEGGITKDQKRTKGNSSRAVPYLRVANVQRGHLDLSEVKVIVANEDEIESLRLRSGDVLFTEGGDRDKLGRGWVWNDELPECIHQNHIFRARLTTPDISPKFVSYHGNFFGQRWFSRTGKQTTNLASINKGVLRRFPVPLAPVHEQRRIVAKIEELFSDLDAGVAALTRAKANLKRYRASVLKAAVEGHLTAAWRAEHPSTEPASMLLARILTERRQKWEADQLAKFTATSKSPPKNWKDKYTEPSPPDTTNLPQLPRGWCWATVEQLIVRSEYGTSVKCDYDGSGPPVLRIPNIAAGEIDLTDIKCAKQLLTLETDDCLLPGDMLMCRTNGSIGLIGKAAVLRSSLSTPHAFASYLLRFRFGEVETLPSWVHAFVSSFHGRRFIESHAASSAGQHNISLSLVHTMPIPLPPAGEQQQIIAEAAERLSQIDAAETQIEHGLLRAARLRQSILKQAFEGKLVPQDPADEPASELLSRLKEIQVGIGVADSSVPRQNGRKRKGGVR